MALPQRLTLTQTQSQWASQLDPIIANPTTNPGILKSISLATGSNAVNHLLGRNLQGWKIIRQRAAASIYDTQDSNPTPQLTLVLVSTAPVVIDLEVF